MTALTTEHLDKKLSQFKGDIESHIDERFDELAQLVSRGFEDVDKRLSQRIDKLERKTEKVERALDIKL